MLKKSYSKTGQKCRVTFSLPAEAGAELAVICGEFNGWDPTATPLKRRKDGSFSTTLWLAAGREYSFRYLLDGWRWENDWAADAYVPGSFGAEDSVVSV